MTRLVIFISSVQKELAEERGALKEYIEGDALLSRFFEVILFETFPAADRRADHVYLDQVDRCDLYVGLFGNDYGYEDAAGVSPTEREFDRATQQGKTRLIYVKGADDKVRHPKMAALIRKAGDQLIRRRFGNVDELKVAVYASLVDALAERGVVSDRPFDERSCTDATLADLDADAVATFVHLARAKRDFPLAENTPVQDVLTHLGLFRDGIPANAAVLLFGRTPQRFIPCAEVRCMHFHGTEIMRPAPFYRIFKGTLFSQVEAAANFVLSVTNLSVGTRALGPQAPVKPEIPPDVVREAIVNALAHRDYTSHAAVQVAVFADRVEIWNPGELLPPLTPDSLRIPHRSITRNHRMCEALFLAGYIEKYGTGTLMMIRESMEHALPEPMFKQSGGEFVATIGRDWLTEEVMNKSGLNERQRRAVVYVQSHGQITNAVYRSIAGVIRKTAARDLEELVSKGLFRQVGATGRGAHYVFSGKRDINETNGTQTRTATKRDINGTNGTLAGGGIDSQTTQMTHRKSGTGTKQRRSRSEACRNPAAAQVTTQVGTKSGPSRDQVAVLRKCLGESEIGDLMAVVGRSNRTKFRDQVLNPMLESGQIEMTIPDKPTSRLQKYRLTEKGRAWLRKVRP